MLKLIITNDGSHSVEWGEGAIDAFPLDAALTAQLNYGSLLPPPAGDILEKIHQAKWNEEAMIGPPQEAKTERASRPPAFTLLKSVAHWPDYRLHRPADLVFYDPFDPTVHPELWTMEVFASLFSQLAPGAVLVTYCCKGEVRRSLRAAGFLVEKLPGPPGKREILRAHKPAAPPG